MSTVFAWIFPGGRLIQAVTSITLGNNLALQNKASPGSGKRWFVLNVKISNPDSVSRTLSIQVYKESALTNLVKTLCAGAVATLQELNYPTQAGGDLGRVGYPTLIILDEANQLVMNWAAGGTSAGGTDADGQVIEYLEIDL